MNVPGSNVARHLRIAATEHPAGLATKSPTGVSAAGEVRHEVRTFRQLDQESDAAAGYFASAGITEGSRVLLAVRPGHDLIVGMFALLKLGAVPVAIDPGMGWSAFLDCVTRSRPTALVGVNAAVWLSYLPFKAFRTLSRRVTVGGSAWRQALASASPTPRPLAATGSETLAAILFTSGSTGAPKGVCYTHGMFDAQIELVRTTYALRPGETDMAMLPLFALFNPALGATTVTPLLDPSKPLAADPAPIVSALIAEKVTRSFGSPAIWSKVADHCEARGLKLPDLRRLLIAGAATLAAPWVHAQSSGWPGSTPPPREDSLSMPTTRDGLSGRQTKAQNARFLILLALKCASTGLGLFGKKRLRNCIGRTAV